MTCDVIKTDFAIYPRLNKNFSILKHVDDVEAPKDQFCKIRTLQT